jgi:hypothetical protein
VKGQIGVNTMNRELRVGDKVDVDFDELGICVVVKIAGRYAWVRSEKVSTYYECEPGDDRLYSFRASYCAEKIVK